MSTIPASLPRFPLRRDTTVVDPPTRGRSVQSMSQVLKFLPAEVFRFLRIVWPSLFEHRRFLWIGGRRSSVSDSDDSDGEYVESLTAWRLVLVELEDKQKNLCNRSGKIAWCTYELEASCIISLDKNSKRKQTKSLNWTKESARVHNVLRVRQHGVWSIAPWGPRIRVFRVSDEPCCCESPRVFFGVVELLPLDSLEKLWTQATLTLAKDQKYKARYKKRETLP